MKNIVMDEKQLHIGALVEIHWDKLPKDMKPLIPLYQRTYPHARGIIESFVMCIKRKEVLSVDYCLGDWTFPAQCLSVYKSVFERIEDREKTMQYLRDKKK